VLETASYVLKTSGTVIPVTFQKSNLCVQYESGTVLKGEGNIDENNPEKTRINKTYLEPAVEANKDAIEALKSSDYIIVGPGDLHTSIIPSLLVNGIKEAIQESKAKIIYILNLMTKNGQTTNYAASDFLNDITHYLGRTPDFIIAHKGSIPRSIIDWYENYDEHPVKNDLTHENFKGTMKEEDDGLRPDSFFKEQVKNFKPATPKGGKFKPKIQTDAKAFAAEQKKLEEKPMD
jgi:uncharacterized cofD-like protein